MHSCVITRLPALILVYCKQPHANHSTYLPLCGGTQWQHVAQGSFQRLWWSLHTHAGKFVQESIQFLLGLFLLQKIDPQKQYLSFLWPRKHPMSCFCFIMGCFCRLCRNKDRLMIWGVPLTPVVFSVALASSHLISGPQDINVYRPTPPCNKVSTCLPAGLPASLCVFGFVQGVSVRPWKCETVFWQADLACWRAWQRRDVLFDQVCGSECKWEKKKRGSREQKTVREQPDKCDTFFCDACWSPERHCGGWSRIMMNSDGSTWTQLLLAAGLNRAEGREEKHPPAVSWRRAKIERDPWSICLFISSHMLHPAMLQWVGAMRHKVNGPSALRRWGNVSTFKSSLKLPVGKEFWHLIAGQWICCQIYMPPRFFATIFTSDTYKKKNKKN